METTTLIRNFRAVRAYVHHTIDDLSDDQLLTIPGGAPNNILWCIRGDGKMATLTREIDQEVAAWTEQVAGGTGSYENVTVIPATTATDGDEVWFVVNRTVNGVQKRFVEYLDLFDWELSDEEMRQIDSLLS